MSDKLFHAGSMITDEEMRELILFNNTITPYPKLKTLHVLFEEQVLRTPDHVALMLGDESLTYRAVNEKSNQLARRIIELGVKPGDNVGLLTERNFDMIIGMYAILKAGGAYVPVDPHYPIERQHYILSNSAVSLLVSGGTDQVSVLMPDLKILNVRDLVLNEYSAHNLDLSIDSQQLAYTIYTSGSTGKPKGVMIAHHSAVNLIQWVNNSFHVGVNDRLLFVTSMCFDLSVYDIFGILSAGGSLVIAAQEQVNDLNKLLQMLQDYEITFWDSVPSTFDYLIRELESTDVDYKQHHLRLVFLSGDWIPVSLPDRIKHFFPAAAVISLGGATEATVWSNYFPIEKIESSWISIPYGKPIANNFFYILNDQLQPVPIGEIGELFIGGVGVARGYANNAEKTKASFVPDPFNKDYGGIMYRTGDHGRMLPGMNMEFIGRKDDQVKIHGFRVELGEIEHLLNQSANLKAAVVLAKMNKTGQKDLICYVVPAGKFDKHANVDYLKQRLPDYMVPAIWLELQSLPLNINGKVDRKALLDLEIPTEVSKSHKEAVTPQEKIMVAIWQDVFSLENIGIEDDFFELGGHSLMGLHIMSQFEWKTGIKLPLESLFKTPTIAGLLASISDKEEEKKSHSLIPIKATGSKMPLYIIHGDGLYVLSFKDLAKYVDAEQPLYGLQPADLNGTNQHTETLADIASHYVSEIIAHNPNGPYAVAGYSFGGYVAIEMAKQFASLGKELKMLGIFDTDAENVFYAKSWRVKLPRKIKRQFPKLLWIFKSFLKDPSSTLNYQYNLFTKGLRKLIYRVGLRKDPKKEGVYSQINAINQKHQEAFKAYNLEPFNNFVYLFKAKNRVYFVDDIKSLSWNKYAIKGVKVYDVPGDHATMLHDPHAQEFGQKLQEALNNC
ncbi:non-ribosomal peptide synthetase [Pedobacter gandavensis]|uniref:Amino acid adenylation domain-containing protein n=1 Tax=Pedobacter gandavensis TaxID=2679963 RepID=A0ABR6ESK4_9SPHI|nr:amino acid adenylation domain-containing protein [Pedobacter gandavensis]MBB2148032.1 amino acid adenylation domain-containing protein [Pedobacter gandavensis]